jgi:GntR family transcriptional regulator
MSDRTPRATHFARRPLYLQVRDALAARIAAREWKPNVAIPNESDLAREFGVSPGTMRKALELMEGERLLRRRQGRGTFVNDQTSDELLMRYRNIRTADGNRIAGEIKVLNISLATPSPAECARLLVAQDDCVWRIRRIRGDSGKPFMVEDSVVPAALFPALDTQDELSRGIPVLAQQYGILLGKGDERISIGSASSAVAETLNLSFGAPILMLDRLLHTIEGHVVEWRLGTCHFADKYYLSKIH